MQVWLNFEDLMWSSDWNGYEVGYDDIGVVGLYTVKDMDIDLYIDMETMQILEIFCTQDHE